MGRTDDVLAALSRLAVLPAHSEKVQRCAYELQLLAGFARISNLPRAQNSQKRDGGRLEVEKLARLAGDLGRHILAMHSDALRALEAASCKPHPLQLLDDLKATIEACVTALDHGEFAEPREGAPTKAAAARVTAHVLRYYEFLTGNRATIVVDPASNIAGGPFLDIVRELLPLLGINASPESQARSAIKIARGKELNGRNPRT